MLCWNFNVELDIFASSASIHTVYMKWNNKKLFQSYQFFFWFLKSLCMWSRLGARRPPALPCPATYTQYPCSVGGVCRLALVAKLNQRLFGTTKSPVHQHRGTAGSLYQTKDHQGCNQQDLQAAALLICVIAYHKDTFRTEQNPNLTFTALTYPVALQSDFINEVKLQDWVRLHSKMKQKVNITPFYFPAFKGRFNAFNLKPLQQLIPS